MNLYYSEEDLALESVFALAMEQTSEKLLTTKERNALDDSCFGIIYTNSNGKVVRAYPLKVPGDKKKTTELVQKSLDMYHYCLPQNKSALAKKILQVITEEKLSVKISKRNQILKRIPEDDFPETVIFYDAKK